MELFAQLTPFLVLLSLAMLVFSVGLQSGPDEVLYLFKRPKALLKAVLAVYVVVPIVAVFVTSLFPLSAVSKAGILLMALSPTPPLVPGNQMKVGGRKDYAYGLYVAMVVLAIAMVPATVAVISAWYHVHVAIGAGAIAWNVGLNVVLPLGLGLAVNAMAPPLAKRLLGWVDRLAMGLVLLTLIALVVRAWPAMRGLTGDGTVAAVVLVVLLSLGFGHLLGGPGERDRATLAVTAATRHPGIAMMIAGANFADPRIDAAIILFLVVGLFAATPYRMWIKRREAEEGPVIAHHA